ncbi:phospho-N-acetylmuramoyl-pentapeptide-transferase [bacterium]|jgi:phospho-N-acetylmuramoyl-pentapeptide-transferase|nr:phospho-N-acetylmuramoyl-pentapeptide-transferase [bacterium]MBT5014895.1 phospho-N-acetylmuramoyl-pentapeptide-transferase [bacterium]
MIYALSRVLINLHTGFNVLHYVSFRSIAALLSALILSILVGNWFIYLAQRQFRSKQREYTPETHQSKSDMPTMGGLFILFVVSITTLFWCDLSNRYIWIFLFTLWTYGVIGFFDDWSKIKQKQGISARSKILLQAGAALLISVLLVWWGGLNTTLSVPFIKSFSPQLGVFFIPWALFVLIGTSNAVNLTDGLDGLAIGSLILNFATFASICYLAGHTVISAYLGIPFAHTAELTVVGGALVGASLGFLWYNSYPAQIFMGDVGSLALGAVLGLMALMSKQEMLLPIAGGLFVIETLSVIIQVASFRLLGRRFFRMAPIHHHFELIGWKEAKITVRFGIITFILCLIALITLKVR